MIGFVADEKSDGTRHASLTSADIEEAVSSNESEVAKNVVWSLRDSNCFRVIRIIKKSSVEMCLHVFT
jgi:hypothetical protein